MPSHVSRNTSSGPRTGYLGASSLGSLPPYPHKQPPLPPRQHHVPMCLPHHNIATLPGSSSRCVQSVHKRNIEEPYSDYSQGGLWGWVCCPGERGPRFCHCCCCCCCHDWGNCWCDGLCVLQFLAMCPDFPQRRQVMSSRERAGVASLLGTTRYVLLACIYSSAH